MKKLPNAVLRYQKEAIWDLYQLVRDHKASIDFVKSGGAAYATFHVMDINCNFVLPTGVMNVTELLDAFDCAETKVCMKLKRFLEALREFCSAYNVTIKSPGSIYVGNHKAFVLFRIAPYYLYEAWQHFEVPEEEDEDYD